LRAALAQLNGQRASTGAPILGDVAVVVRRQRRGRQQADGRSSCISSAAVGASPATSSARASSAPLCRQPSAKPTSTGLTATGRLRGRMAMHQAAQEPAPPGVVDAGARGLGAAGFIGWRERSGHG
jgi:hypothetical protein